MWQVMIVEDDRRMREFLSASVRNCSELNLVGAVDSRVSALAWLRQSSHEVDVLLVDLGLPDGSGLEVIRAALLLNPKCDALVVSMFGDDKSVLDSIEAGAIGYIQKDAAPNDIATAILDMKAGASPISPMIARRILARCREYQDQDRRTNACSPLAPGADTMPSGPVKLSEREHDVLDLLSRGFTYTEVARLKSVTVDTIRSHIRHLYNKLAVHSRAEAVFEASKMGLLNKQATPTP